MESLQGCRLFFQLYTARITQVAIRLNSSSFSCPLLLWMVSASLNHGLACFVKYQSCNTWELWSILKFQRQDSYDQSSFWLWFLTYWIYCMKYVVKVITASEFGKDFINAMENVKSILRKKKTKFFAEKCWQSKCPSQRICYLHKHVIGSLLEDESFVIA